MEHEFQCTVCLNPIADCYITRCGHVYCRNCIEEAVGRHHRCPFCNQDIKDFKTDVFKNYHFNTLMKIIDDEKRRENQKYLDKTFGKMAKIREDREGENLLMAPVEQVSPVTLRASSGFASWHCCSTGSTCCSCTPR